VRGGIHRRAVRAAGSTRPVARRAQVVGERRNRGSRGRSAESGRDYPAGRTGQCAQRRERAAWRPRPAGAHSKMNRTRKLALLLLSLAVMACAADLPSKKWLNLAAIKKMVAGAEAEAARRNVQVTVCIVDESGNLLFLQKADGAGLNTIQFAQKKARYAAI